MQRLVLVAVLHAVLVLGGCVAYRLTTGHASPIDPAVAEHIRPGTPLSDVLSRLGPPDYIVDGTRRIIDAAGGPPRVLTAPDGAVILVYGHASSETTFMGGGLVPGAEARSAHLVADVFVFVSKTERVVLHTARTVPTR